MGVVFGQYHDSSYRKQLKRNFCTSEKLVRRDEFVVLSRLPDCGLGFGLSAFKHQKKRVPFIQIEDNSYEVEQLIVTQPDFLWVFSSYYLCSSMQNLSKMCLFKKQF